MSTFFIRFEAIVFWTFDIEPCANLRRPWALSIQLCSFGFVDLEHRILSAETYIPFCSGLYFEFSFQTNTSIFCPGVSGSHARRSLTVEREVSADIAYHSVRVSSTFNNGSHIPSVCA